MTSKEMTIFEMIPCHWSERFFDRKKGFKVTRVSFYYSQIGAAVYNHKKGRI